MSSYATRGSSGSSQESTTLEAISFSLRCSQALGFVLYAHSWEQRKLGDEFSFLRNNTLSRAELSISRGTAFDVHYGDVLVAFGSVVNPRVDKLPRIASDDVALSLSCDRLRDGDVIIADTAEDFTAGKCSELRGVGELTVFSGLHTIPLRPLQGYAPGFLGYCLNAPAYRKQLVPLMQGVKVISISRVALTGTVLTAPSLPEQRAIGAFFSSVDDLIVLRQREQNQVCGAPKASPPAPRIEHLLSLSARYPLTSVLSVSLIFASSSAISFLSCSSMLRTSSRSISSSSSNVSTYRGILRL